MSSCFVIEMVYEKTLFIALHCIHQFKSKAVFDSNFQSALDYGFLVRETNGFWIPIVSGIADSLMGWMPRNSDFFSKDFPDSGFRIPQAKISRIPEFGLPGDSKWLKDGVCVFFGGHFIFFGRLLCDLEPEKFWGVRDNWKFRKFSKIYSLTDPLPTMYKRNPIGFARIFVSRPCFSWTHNSNYVRRDKEIDSFIYNNPGCESPLAKPCGQTRINFLLKLIKNWTKLNSAGKLTFLS